MILYAIHYEGGNAFNCMVGTDINIMLNARIWSNTQAKIVFITTYSWPVIKIGSFEFRYIEL